MADSTQFVRADEARVLTGLTSRTLDRRLAAGIVRVYRDPVDLRRRLIAVEDIGRLTAIETFDRARVAS